MLRKLRSFDSICYSSVRHNLPHPFKVRSRSPLGPFSNIELLVEDTADEELDAPNPSRDFVLRHVRTMQDGGLLIWEDGVGSDVDALERVLKPIPTCNMRGRPIRIEPLQLYGEFFRGMPGDVVLFDVIGNERVVNGHYA